MADEILTGSPQRGGRIIKSFILDPETGRPTGAFPSKQVVDPFIAGVGYGQWIQPPFYSFEQLALLVENHPIHAACIEQKVVDTVAGGLEFSPRTEDAKADDDQRKDMLEWWEDLFDEYTSYETMIAFQEDYETVGWGGVEIARDIQGIARRMYYVPGHTLRAHTSNQRFVQIRNGKRVWFTKWGSEEQILASSGHRVGSRKIDPEKVANELLVFRRLSRRSIWYGIPRYIAAVGHIAMGISARDFNIKFFDNYREPRHLIVITGLDDDVEHTMDEIEKRVQSGLKGQPHKNIVIPIEGDAQVTVHALGTNENDMHFARLMEQIDGEIMIAHRIPPDRIGAGRRGFLGGSVAYVVNSIYKDGVVGKAQSMLESRLNRFVRREYAMARNIEEDDVMWKVDLQELDIADQDVEISIATQKAQSNLFGMNEIRESLGHDRYEAFSDMTLLEWQNSLEQKAGLESGSLNASADDTLSPMQRKAVDRQLQKYLEDVDGFVEELLTRKSEELEIDYPVELKRTNGS